MSPLDRKVRIHGYSNTLCLLIKTKMLIQRKKGYYSYQLLLFFYQLFLFINYFINAANTNSKYLCTIQLLH